jgi:hypothetical protein
MLYAFIHVCFLLGAIDVETVDGQQDVTQKQTADRFCHLQQPEMSLLRAQNPGGFSNQSLGFTGLKAWRRWLLQAPVVIDPRIAS